ncbi:MAG: hypothetical protein WCT77_07585 [Bacteroidota bacterium]|jgi:hypothetical protein
MKNKLKLLILLSVFLITGTNSDCFAYEKYLLKCNSKLLTESKRIAIAQVGTFEKTNRNDGDVEKYLNAVGLKRGSAYCAAGQYYCFFKASQNLKLITSSIPLKRTGLANAMFADAKIRGKKAYFRPTINDLIIWRHSNTIYGHTERILEVKKAGWVLTVAFNVKNHNGTEGVFFKKRNVCHPLGRMAIRGLIGFAINN